MTDSFQFPTIDKNLINVSYTEADKPTSAVTNARRPSAVCIDGPSPIFIATEQLREFTESVLETAGLSVVVRRFVKTIDEIEALKIGTAIVIIYEDEVAPQVGQKNIDGKWFFAGLEDDYHSANLLLGVHSIEVLWEPDSKSNFDFS